MIAHIIYITILHLGKNRHDFAVTIVDFDSNRLDFGNTHRIFVMSDNIWIVTDSILLEPF